MEVKKTIKYIIALNFLMSFNSCVKYKEFNIDNKYQVFEKKINISNSQDYKNKIRGKAVIYVYDCSNNLENTLNQNLEVVLKNENLKIDTTLFYKNYFEYSRIDSSFNKNDLIIYSSLKVRDGTDCFVFDKKQKRILHQKFFGQFAPPYFLQGTN
jgi:hypothetical protein